jgi:hypothetical protein
MHQNFRRKLLCWLAMVVGLCNGVERDGSFVCGEVDVSASLYIYIHLSLSLSPVLEARQGVQKQWDLFI